MKFLLLLVVVGVAVAWLWLRPGRRKVPPPKATEASAATPKSTSPSTTPPTSPAAMLACARCGVHLPSPEALFDDRGRPFCGADHRLAGPG